MAAKTKDLSPEVLQAMQEAIAAESLPDVHWLYGDDLCDCTFQRIGSWSNAYLGRTLRVRMCCIWAELYKAFPQFVQEIPAYYDANRHKWEVVPCDWDSKEVDMPLPIWYRQLAVQTGRSVADIREEYSKRASERPKKLTKGKGRRLKQPTEAEVKAAHEARALLGGWTLGRGGTSEQQRQG